MKIIEKMSYFKDLRTVGFADFFISSDFIICNMRMIFLLEYFHIRDTHFFMHCFSDMSLGINCDLMTDDDRSYVKNLSDEAQDDREDAFAQ